VPLGGSEGVGVAAVVELATGAGGWCCFVQASYSRNNESRNTIPANMRKLSMDFF
jgi:hypothetical protein